MLFFFASRYTQLTPFQENLSIYTSLEQHVTRSAAGGARLAVVAENDSRRLHCSLRDLSSFLQAVGRLVDHFIADKFQANFHDAHSLVEKYVMI